MKKKLIVFILIVSILLMNIPMNCYAKVPNVELLISGEDEQPGTPLLVNLKGSKNLQLWHHSGGYWSCMGVQINDEELGKDLLNAEKLAAKLKEKLGSQKVEIKVTLTDEQYQKVLKEETVKVFCTLKDKIDTESNKDMTLTKLFSELEVKLIGKDLVVSGYPKFCFYKPKSYQNFIKGHLNPMLPIVDPAYGQNVYAIWSKEGADWGMATGYMKPDLNEEDAIPAGLIAPTQIADSNGNLKEGVVFNCSEKVGAKWNEAGISYGTFASGGAVGISMDYSVTVEIYAGSYPNDLAALKETAPSSKMEGTEAVIGINVKSTYGIDLENVVGYTWTIEDTLGNPIDATYKVNGVTSTEIGSGTLNKISASGSNLLYAAFEMPSTPVVYELKIDGSAVLPSETVLDNNIAEGIINPISVTFTDKDFVLDYNILSRDFRFQVPDSPSTATVEKPDYASWYENGTGSFNVTNQTPILFKNYLTEGTGTFSVNSSSVSKQAYVNTSIERKAFNDNAALNDNPVGKDWLNVSDSFTPIKQGGSINYGGTFSRTYTYTITNGFGSFPQYGTDFGDFAGGSINGTAQVYVYNGMLNVPKKTYTNEITNNTITSLKKNLAWESEPYTFDVIRWMYNQDINGNLYNATAVDGQYDRVFTNQCTGTVEWVNKSTLSNDYLSSRNAAKNRTSVKSQYDKAVFATEKEFKTVDYPIKSGYYFNPTGTYEFTVETVTYKTTKADTEEHKTLVDAVINSFHYESDLMYINSLSQAVNLQNQTLTKLGNSYVKKSASLTAADPTGVNGVTLLNVLDKADDSSRYTKDIEEVVHSQANTGMTDVRFKNILEGYTESGTQTSNTNFKYRETIKEGQKLYKITETTRVTIQINPSNLKVYTHALMKDGEYQVRAWIGDVTLSNSYEYGKLPDIEGIGQSITSGNTYLDNIKINVKGSMYDDIN